MESLLTLSGSSTGARAIIPPHPRDCNCLLASGLLDPHMCSHSNLRTPFKIQVKAHPLPAQKHLMVSKIAHSENPALDHYQQALKNKYNTKQTEGTVRFTRKDGEADPEAPPGLHWSHAAPGYKVGGDHPDAGLWVLHTEPPPVYKVMGRPP